MKQPALFITGTDTGIGKTFYSCQLLQALNAAGYSTLAMKPIAAGAGNERGIFKNDDALYLQQAASVKIPYHEVNPYCFPAPVAPHIAAAETGQHISLEAVLEQYTKLKGRADYILVEGVGGWQVPLNETQTVANLAELLHIPVVMVVGIRLGCINHAMLTANSIQQSSVPFAGWVANLLEKDMPALNKNIKTLQHNIAAPLLDIVQYQANDLKSPLSTMQTKWLQNIL